MRALVTGITGFAGAFLTDHLLACGDSVLGCSSSGAWPSDAPRTIAERVQVLKWDIGRDDGLKTIARRRIEAFAPTCIYHLAAMSVPQLCGGTSPTRMAWEVNVNGTRRVLEFATSLSPAPRVLCISSSHVYAPTSLGSGPVNEDYALGPRRGYGITKLAVEHEARRAASRGLDVVIARPFQHTGPRQGPKMMLPEWISQFSAPDDCPISVHTLDAHIDVTDVRDTVRAYRLLINHAEPGATLNVGSGICRRTADILDMVQRHFITRRLILESCPGDKQDPICDTDRLHRTTGWRANISLEQTVLDTVDYWRHRFRSQRFELAVNA